MTCKRCYKESESKIFLLLAAPACIALLVLAPAALAETGSSHGKSVAVQTDGKIVVAGYAGVGRADRIALVRYNTDGTLDTSFNGSGKVITAVGEGDCKGEGVAVQRDDKIVVAGYSFANGRAEFTVLRYNADGKLDAGFGESGKVTTRIGRNSDSARSVALQSDGKIVVVGDVFAPGNNDFGVARYNPNGTLDTAFNKTGKTTTDFGKVDYARSVTIQTDGKIVVAGDAAKDDIRSFAVARFNADGTLDTSLNKTGKVITDFGKANAEVRAVAVQGDGKIVVAGFTSVDGPEKFAVVRYNADGKLDTDLGGTGKVLTLVGMSGSNATSMALQSDGKIVVAGYAINNSGRGRDFAIVRYNANGSLDTTFNGSGKVATAVSDDDGHCEAVALEEDGKIVAAGWASDGDDSDFAVVRFGSDGKLDSTFNSAGKVTTSLATNPSGDPVPKEEENRSPCMATITDPDGFTNVRDSDNKIIAKVKAGERFIAQSPGDKKQRSVRLKSGITGWMDRSRIRLLPDEPLMKFNYDASRKEWRKFQSKKGGEDGETASAAKGQGVDYYKTLVRASEGNIPSLARLFSLADSMDGAAAEGYYPEMWELFHLVGDKKFAEFLRQQALNDQIGARGILREGLSELSGNERFMDYLERYFPETTKILYRGEIVDWISPDGRYAIRKTFSNPLDLTNTKVNHAELIEKDTGKAICDLTAEDIGAGSAREGSVLWSPDSKRFAYVSSDIVHAGNRFGGPPTPPRKTQTAVFERSDNSFTKVGLSLNQPAGQENDRELVGAVMEHDFITPVRWENPNTLILEKHDYYEKLTASSGTIHGFARLYEITVSFKEDGTASTSWKIQENR